MLRSPDQILVRARALSTLATALYSRGFYERAEPLWRESLEILENADHEAGMARVIGNLGLIEWQIRGNYDLARELYERGLKLSVAANLPSLEALYLGNLGEIYFATGDLQRAADLGHRSLDIFQDLGNESFVADQLKLIAKYEFAERHEEAARDLLDEALVKFLELDQDIEIAECFVLAAEIAISQEDLDKAAKLLAFSDQLLLKGQRTVATRDRERMSNLRTAVSNSLGDRLTALEAIGRALTREDAIKLNKVTTPRL